MIRINELARELEIPSRQIIELVPQFGVAEKKTHSSSVEEDVADALRHKFGKEIPVRPDVSVSTPEPSPLPEAKPVSPEFARVASPAPVAPPAPETSSPVERKPVEDVPVAAATRPVAPPLRPPLSSGNPIHPPLASTTPAAPSAAPGAPIAPPVTARPAIPVRPAPSAPRPGQILSG